ncbi:MAG: hypothetical protein CV087_22950 [Candidatus Brocadia sp. WS118]|nr:MAG: hypothetical protein CV087_22950 [Candidatus Brocadia sp. WS118]
MSERKNVKQLYHDYIFGFIPVDEQNQAKFMYFVGHAYRRPFSKDLRRAVRQTFEPRYVPYFADDEIQPRHILIKIARKIYTTLFGLFELSNYSPSVYVELGLAFGLNKKAITIVREDAKSEIPTWLSSLNTLEYDSYRELPEKLKLFWDELEKPIDEPTSSKEACICYFCHKWCSNRHIKREAKYYLVLDALKSRRPTQDFRKAVEMGLRSTGLIAKYIDTQLDSPWELCQLARYISNSEFVICRIGKNVAPLVFFGFGASLGFRRPPVLLVEEEVNLSEIAANLGGWDYYSYNDYEAVKEYLQSRAKSLVEEARFGEIPDSYLEFGRKKVEVLKDIRDLLERDMTFEDKLEGALILALYALRTDAGSLMLITKDQNWLEIKAIVSPWLDLEDVEKWRAFKIGEGIAGWVAKNNQAYLTSNVNTDLLYVKGTFNPNLVSLITVPIAYEGQVLGVLNGDSDHENHFDEHDIPFLMEVSRLLAPKIYSQIMEPPADKVSKEEDKTTVQHLFRDPICLNCGHTYRIRFLRVQDEKELRYRLMTVCDNCNLKEAVRTYTL